MFTLILFWAIKHEVLFPTLVSRYFTNWIKHDACLSYSHKFLHDQKLLKYKIGCKTDVKALKIEFPLDFQVVTSCSLECNSEAVDLVCGDDGITYKNLCEVQKANCGGNKGVLLKHKGACRLGKYTIVYSLIRAQQYWAQLVHIEWVHFRKLDFVHVQLIVRPGIHLDPRYRSSVGRSEYER